MSELDQIISKLEVIDGKVDQLLQWKAAVNERCKAHRQQTEEVRMVLFKNPGLKSKVERLWNCKNNITRWREFWMYILRLVVAAGIVGLVGWLLLLYKSMSLLK